MLSKRETKINRLITIAICAVASVSVIAQPALQQSSLVPEIVELAESVKNAISADWLTEEERSALRVFHGIWDDKDLTSPALEAEAALIIWDLNNPIFNNPEVPVEIRAEALAFRGEVDEAIKLLEGASSLPASRIRAESLEVTGDFKLADQTIDEPVNLLLSKKIEDAKGLTDGVRSLIVRSRLRGQPSRDYGTMMELLAKARNDYDRLYWPATLTEAELLLSKDNFSEAIKALHEVLSFNPRSSKAWLLLGEVAISRFDFDSANLAANHLKRLNRRHPLANILLAEISLVQNDPDLALEYLDDVISNLPKFRLAYAYRCAAIALFYDKEALDDVLAEYDELAPGSGMAYYQAGTTLSLDRQYQLAAELLNEAVRRQPKWPAPQIELALLEMQSGRDALALAALREARELDRFNKRIANSIYLLEELMANFVQVESEHFIIRYSPDNQDKVVVDLMVDKLEEIHETVAGRYEHQPDRKTVIELMPDHKWFGVRIGGMPNIHTIAACTGPVIAMEVPREGAKQKHFGKYDWPRVIQHEYTHTITLSQTRNRIPHWLTEAAAVSMEPGPRAYKTIQMLVSAYLNDNLFTLDKINWAFIRPKRAGDRNLAYAQGFWMVEYMNQRFGNSALIRLLERYFDGEREEDAIPNALGISREEFFESFLAWADVQVKAWGFNTEPSLEELKDTLRNADPKIVEQMKQNNKILLNALARIMTSRVGVPASEREESFGAKNWPKVPKPVVAIDDEQLADWLEEYPNHPDLLHIAMKHILAMQEDLTPEAIALILRYTSIRPVDPEPHRVLAKYFRQNNSIENAIPHLEFLDIREQYDEVYAHALAIIYRKQKQKDLALKKITRAVNINPYNAPLRELAASISIEGGDLNLAKTHIVALTILEPNRPQHEKRLKAINNLLNKRDNS